MSLAILEPPPLPKFVRSRIVRPSGPLALLVPGTLADLVFEFFSANPEEELLSSDIAIKFDAAGNNVSTALARAVELGLLDREVVRTFSPDKSSRLQHLYRIGNK